MGQQPAELDSFVRVVTQGSSRGPAGTDQQAAARAFMSWWDAATRLCVAASALLLATGMTLDLQANARALAQLAGSSAARLPSGAVRLRGPHPAILLPQTNDTNT